MSNLHDLVKPPVSAIRSIRRLTDADRIAGLRWATAWRIRNKRYFDALYGPEPALPPSPAQIRNRKKMRARAWREANQPYFDALYGAQGEQAHG